MEELQLVTDGPNLVDNCHPDSLDATEDIQGCGKQLVSFKKQVCYVCSVSGTSVVLCQCSVAFALPIPGAYCGALRKGDDRPHCMRFLHA